MTAEWDRPTPTGHIYRTPDTIADVRERCNDYGQGWAEGWMPNEMVPDPTWEIVGMLMDEIERLHMLPDIVKGDYTEAAKTHGTPLSHFYAGAIDATDEVGRRMREGDHG